MYITCKILKNNKTLLSELLDKEAKNVTETQQSKSFPLIKRTMLRVLKVNNYVLRDFKHSLKERLLSDIKEQIESMNVFSTTIKIEVEKINGENAEGFNGTTFIAMAKMLLASMNQILDSIRSFNYRMYPVVLCNPCAAQLTQPFRAAETSALALSNIIGNELSRDINVLIDYDNTPSSFYDLLIDKMCYNNIRLYAYSSKQVRYEDRDYFEKVAIGKMSNNIISNNVFDIVAVTPKISLEDVVDLNGRLVYDEVNEIKRVANYVAERGILLINMPYYKVSEEVIRALSSEFDFISAFKQMRRCNILLVVKRIPFNEEKRLNKLSTFYDAVQNAIDNFDSLPDISDDDCNALYDYDILDTSTEYHNVRIFKGTLIDEAELEMILRTSSASIDLINEYNNLHSRGKDIKPILPLTAGQAGLALASGEINGIIKEDDNYSHIIKGKVNKVTVEKKIINYTTNEKTDDALTIEQTDTNTVEISILGGDGYYKNIGVAAEGIGVAAIEEIGEPLSVRGVRQYIVQ